MDKESILVTKNMEDWGSISEGVCIVMQNISDQLWVWKQGPQLVALFRKVMETLGGGT